MKRYSERESWINEFPGVRKKFLNQCIVCQEIGYDPVKVQTKEGKYFRYFIEKYWHPLAVDELGMCEICAERVASEKKEQQ